MTEEMESQLAMYMRVSELMRRNMDAVDKNKKLQAPVVNLNHYLSQIFELLTQDESDHVLDRYREEAKYLSAM